jgi:hypothetical protein
VEEEEPAEVEEVVQGREQLAERLLAPGPQR